MSLEIMGDELLSTHEVLQDILSVEDLTKADTPEKRVDLLAQAYATVVTTLHQQAQIKAALVQTLDAWAQQPDKLSGTVKLQGDTVRVTVTRSENTSYTKRDGDEVPFLQTVFEMVPELRAALTLSIKEKPAAMTKAISKLENALSDSDPEVSADLQEILKEIRDRRVFKQATPQVKVSPV